MINRLLDHGEEFAEAMRKRMEEEGDEVPGNTPVSDEVETDGGAEEEETEDDLTGLDGFDEATDENEGVENETEQRINAMENRVEDVEDGVDEVRSSLRTMEEKQDEVSESIDEIDERMRKLLGIYDKVTSESNPFSDDVPEDGDADGFGVVPGDAEEAPAGKDDETDETGAEDEAVPDEEVTSYEDLRRDVPEEDEMVENVVEEPRDGTEEFAEIPKNGGANGDDEPPYSDRLDGTVRGVGVEEDIGEHPLPSNDDEKPFLDGFEPSYAADIIVMEWMSVMTVRADPAGAFKALDYYESIGWISSDVRDYLETVVGGPGVDSHVNPGDVESPAIRDHKMSHSYIRQLKEITEM
jgi:archaellum component FlaD/FlaE/archaellum component FlaC